MQKIFPLLALLLMQPVSASVVAHFGFEDSSGLFSTAPESALTPLTIGDWSDQDNTLTSFSGVSGRAAAAKDWQDGNAFIFDILVPVGQSLNLTRFDFDEKASTTGATGWRLNIAGQEVANASTSTHFQHHGSGLALTPLSGTVPIRLAGSGASSGSGTWRVDNFSLQGELTSVPLPGAWLGLCSALLLGGLLGRRPTSRRGCQ